ncbi:MFS general substrate transporter, partial [Rhizodiscina lignyota]
EDNAFPSRQLFVLAVCRICEPIAFMSIFPYTYYMIESFNITQNHDEVAFYAGMVTSAFALAEGLASAIWGRLSDQIGRKPVLLTGLAGTGLSMLMFGFAPNLWVALLARALGGILNGNIGVLHTTVAEVVTVEAHQPRAYTIMPFVWSLGSIVGAGLGGTLADPVRNYPGIFQPGTIFDRFPYLLPNLVCAGVVVLGLIVGLLFLEETHEDKQYRRDYGLELGNWILSLGRRQPIALRESKMGCFEETLGFLAEDPLPEYQSARPSTASSSDRSFDSGSTQPLDCYKCEKPSSRRALTKQVMLNIIAYGILAFHTISFEQLLPIMFSMPKSNTLPSLPFKFEGGFALPTKTIGWILSSQGLLQMLVQLFVFPVINRKFGSLVLFRASIAVYPILYFALPYLVLLPGKLRFFGIFWVLLLKVSTQSFTYPSLLIMLANHSPSKKVLGSLNGYAAASASLCRAIGPTFSGFIQAKGSGLGYSGLAWWVCSFIAIVGVTESLWM